MSIPINILQSMISRNRNTIYELESKIIWYSGVDHLSGTTRKVKKELKALVAIQKALKKEINLLISINKLRNDFKNYGKNVKDVS